MARVTMSDVAKALGVSVSTVSLALRGSPRISASVREKVAQEAAAQGYRTDLAGALLRTSRPQIMGLVCDVGQELHVEYSREVIAAAESLGWLVMMEDTAVGGGAAAVSRIAQLRAQSLIVVDPGSITPQDLRGIEMPLITIGQQPVTEGSDLIRSNNRSGMEQLAGILGQEEQVLWLDGGSSVSSQRRGEALRAALEGSGTEVRCLGSGPTMDAGWHSARRALADGLLAPGRTVGARTVVCYNDQCALGALVTLWQAGLEVPGDVRVVGFDNSRIARSSAFELTSIDRQPRQVARLAVERAIVRAGRQATAPVVLEVDTTLVRRRTA